MEKLSPIRVTSLRDFLVSWYGNPVRSPGKSLGTDNAIPRALREWHELESLFGRPLTFQNHAVKPSCLRFENGKMVFWTENQGCFSWAVGRSGNNPPVLNKESDEETSIWHETGEVLSEFLLHAALFEAIHGAPIKKTGTFTRHQHSTFSQIFNYSIQLNWKYLESSTVIRASDNVLSISSGTGNRFEATVACRDSRHFSTLPKFIQSWETILHGHGCTTEPLPAWAQPSK